MRCSFLAAGIAALMAIDAVAQAPFSELGDGTPISAIRSASHDSLLPLTLDEAWRLADGASTAIRSSAAALTNAEGQLTDARALFWNNPELRGEAIRRSVPQPGNGSDAFREWGIGVQQAFEIAGQQGLRREAATKDLAASQSQLDATRVEIRSQVEQRFVRVLVLQERVATEQDALKQMDNAATAVAKRVKEGEDTRLDGNLALVEAVRARNQVASSREQLLDARSELATLLQLPPEALPEAVGHLEPRRRAYTLNDLLASAAERPQLRTLELREEAARSRLALERASVYPDVTVGVGVGQEGPASARERLVGLNFSVPLPLYRQNAGGIGKASTELTQAQIERQATVRDVSSLVRALWLKVGHLTARVADLEASVVAKLDENQRLSARAYAEGEIGLLQLLVATRQLLDGRRDLLDARAELRFATIALEAMAGVTSASANVKEVK